jgi:hypothetical protein
VRCEAYLGRICSAANQQTSEVMPRRLAMFCCCSVQVISEHDGPPQARVRFR